MAPSCFVRRDCPKLSPSSAEYLLLVMVPLVAKCMPAFRLNGLLFCYEKNRILNSSTLSPTLTVSLSEILRKNEGKVQWNRENIMSILQKMTEICLLLGRRLQLQLHTLSEKQISGEI